MTPALLLPPGLAVLAAVALPLLIHLARRTETVPTDFAALRWLRQKPRPRQRPRFDEWPLLIARLLLIALLALWFARPVLTGAVSSEPVVAIVPGVAPVEGAVWLAPGFLRASEPAPVGPVAIGSLVRELDAMLPAGAKVTVRVPAVIEGADAALPRLSRAVTWQVAPGRMAAPVASPARLPALAVRDGGSVGASYLRAAASALGSRDIGGAERALPKDGAVAWFVPGALPEAVRDVARRGGTVLLPVTATLADAEVIWRDASGAAVAEAAREGRGRLVRFVRPLTAAAMPALVEADFPDRLAGVIGTPASQPARVLAQDYAPVTGARPGDATADVTDLRPWLAMLIAAVLVAERWLATRRKRGVTP